MLADLIDQTFLVDLLDLVILVSIKTNQRSKYPFETAIPSLVVLVNAIIEPNDIFLSKFKVVQLKFHKYNMIGIEKGGLAKVCSVNLILIMQKMSEKRTIIVTHKEPTYSIR